MVRIENKIDNIDLCESDGLRSEFVGMSFFEKLNCIPACIVEKPGMSSRVAG